MKFYYGLDLADAFRATGDRRYLEAWERLVASFVLQVPPDHDSSDVTARRILNWIYAWQRLPEATVPGLVESLRDQARHVRDTLTPERNHRTLELYALLIAALALPDLEPGLLELATRELHANLLSDFGRRRRAPRALDALPHDRPALVRRRARELPPLRRRAAARLRRAAVEGVRLRAAHAAPRRHDPRALRQRHRRLRGAARAGRAAAGAPRARGRPAGPRASRPAATSSSAPATAT